MIEFNGYITGSAERYYKKKFIKLWLFIILIATILFIPITIFVENTFPIKGLGLFINLIGPCLFCVAIVLCTSKKFIKGIIPKKVYIYNSEIHVEIENETESRMIDEVSEVYDFGAFYEICFKKSKDFKYLCQKDKLSKGTLEEFESLFDGKLIRLQTNQGTARNH